MLVAVARPRSGPEVRGNALAGRSVCCRVGLTRRVAGIVAAAIGAVVFAVPATAAEAAEPGLDVEAGYVDGQIVPGRPVPVRVQVRADQLVSGVVTATPYTLGDPGGSVTTPVEVAGGSVKDYLLAVPTAWSGSIGPAEIRVTLTAGGETVTASASLTWTDDVEVVGLVPGVASQAPDPIPLPMGLGRAVFTQLDALALSTPGALGPVGSIATGPAGLTELPTEAQANVLEWVEAGGRLLVDAPPGTAVGGLPDAWQPAGTRAPAGTGWVVLTDGAVARGQWAGIVEPNRQFGPEALSSGACCFTSVPDSVARDAGLRIPDVGWLLAFLVAYVVVVGPLTFVLLRRMRRTNLAWVAVPTVAVLFTAVAFGAGSSLRSGSRAAHGTVVQASPLGDRVVSYVGLVSRDGADPTALFPDGWQVGGIEPWMMRGSMIGDPTLGGQADSGAVVVQGDDGRPGVRLPLSPGDFGMATGRGRVEAASPLEVVAEAAADGSVTGTVTNAADVDLERVIVVVAGQVADVGDLEAGEQAEWRLDGADRAPADPWMAVERPWSDAIGDEGNPDLDSAVNYSVYAAEIGGDIDAYPPGLVVAAGWTDDWVSPVEVGTGVAGGRTAFVARGTVTAAPGTVPGVAVRREFVRGPGAVRFDPPVQIADWGEALGAVARFTLPEGTDPAIPLMLDASAAVAQAEVWVGDGWVPLALEVGGDADAAVGGEAGGGGPDVVIGGVGPPAPVIVAETMGDPFGPPRAAPVPAGAVQGGAVYVRVALSPDTGSSVMLQVRGAA